MECAYRHSRPHQPPTKLPCKFFLKGICTNGAACPYLHPTAAPPAHTIPTKTLQKIPTSTVTSVKAINKFQNQETKQQPKAAAQPTKTVTKPTKIVQKPKKKLEKSEVIEAPNIYIPPLDELLTEKKTTQTSNSVNKKQEKQNSIAKRPQQIKRVPIEAKKQITKQIAQSNTKSVSSKTIDKKAPSRDSIKKKVVDDDVVPDFGIKKFDDIIKEIKAEKTNCTTGNIKSASQPKVNSQKKSEKAPIFDKTKKVDIKEKAEPQIISKQPPKGNGKSEVTHNEKPSKLVNKSSTGKRANPVASFPKAKVPKTDSRVTNPINKDTTENNNISSIDQFLGSEKPDQPTDLDKLGEQKDGADSDDLGELSDLSDISDISL